MITFFRWDCTTQLCTRHPIDALPISAAEIVGDDVLWVNLTNPTPEEEVAVLERFLPVHNLTFADITKPRREPEQGAHFPKVEEFPEYLFVVVNPLPADLAALAKQPQIDPKSVPNVNLTRLVHRNRPQLSAVLTRHVLITHHYQQLACIEETREYLERHGSTARRGPDYLFHLVLDSMVDDYAPVVDRIAARLDRLEQRLFRDPSPRVLSRILRLKRLVVGLRKTLILEREVLARLVRGEFELVAPHEMVYYRNVFDHLVRYTELIESAREMVSDLMQTHLSAASNRLNQVMKTLTMISTVVLPMTLVAGIYGMNYTASMVPASHSPFGFWFAVTLMLAMGVVAFGFFRWRRWI